MQANDYSDFKILFLGGIIPKDIEPRIRSLSRHGYQYAANEFQWDLIMGFDNNSNHKTTLINKMFIGSFPKNYKKLILKEHRFSHQGKPDKDDINLGSINLAMLKHIIRPFFEKRHIKKWIQMNKDYPMLVFIYSFNKDTHYLAKLVKKINPNIVVLTSINDLPEYTLMNRKHGIIERLWLSHNQKYALMSRKYVNGYMVVSQLIAEKLNLHEKNYVVVEGLIDSRKYFNDANYNSRFSENHVIAYTGGLNTNYGVDILLKAFSMITNNNIELILCGNGDLVDTIKEYEKSDKRVSYKGVLSHSEIVKIQNRATVLINPRQNVSDFTKYSFPIKTIEYLISGCPVIGYKLDGIPEEYYDYIITPKDNSVEQLKIAIEETIKLGIEEFKIIGQKNKKFILDNKNNIVQTKRILQMAYELYSKEMTK